MYSFRNLSPKTHLSKSPARSAHASLQKRVAINTVYEIMTQSLSSIQAPLAISPDYFPMPQPFFLLKLSLRATKLLGAERAKVLVQGVDSGAALLQGNNHADIAVRADDNDATLLLV